MTDRVKGLTVVLERDYREDDLEILIDAISLLRGVKVVKKVLAAPADFIVRTKAFLEIEEAINEALAQARKSG